MIEEKSFTAFIGAANCPEDGVFNWDAYNNNNNNLLKVFFVKIMT